MKKETISINRESATLFEMLDYLCSRVNWGKAALDADAIACMNRLFIELRKQKERMEV